MDLLTKILILAVFCTWALGYMLGKIHEELQKINEREEARDAEGRTIDDDEELPATLEEFVVRPRRSNAQHKPPPARHHQAPQESQPK